MIKRRIIVVGLVWNDAGELLFCRMDPNRGVFPGEWGFPGGGMEQGETVEDALRREIREEIGIEIDNLRPVFFKDATYEKRLADGSFQQVYMIFLIFHCKAVGEGIRLNEEFCEYQWVSERAAKNLVVNRESVDTLARIGPWENVH